MSSSRPSVTVIGAGIVGVACALELQASGHAVTVIDPRPPGTATSYGNAGAVADSFVVPYAMPGIWRELPRLLLSRDSPLRLRWQHLPRALPWLIRFLAQATPERARRTAGELASLAPLATSSHRELMRAHSIDSSLLHENGGLKLHRHASTIDTEGLEHQLYELHGVKREILGAEELRQLEPSLSREFTAAEFFPGMGSVAQSILLTEGYAGAFERLGGRFLRETVRRFEIGPEGPRRVVTDLGMHAVERLVISAGAWSRPLCRALGSEVPLDTERGYHVNVEWTESVTLNRILFDSDYDFVMVPMRDGVRITSGEELGGLSLPPDFTRIHRVLARARRNLIGLTGAVNREWMGYRPSFPDSKPAIARSPHFADVYFAFGHGHLGLTLAAVTARLIRELVTGTEPSVDLTPFRIDRF